MQTEIAEPLHHRILVPLGALIALAAALLATAVICLLVTAPTDVTAVLSETGAASMLRALAALVMEAFWWLLALL